MKTADLYIDAATGALITSEGHSARADPAWYRGDRFLLRLHYLDVTEPGQPGGVAPHALPTDSTWKLGGKKQANSEIFLFFSDADQWNIPGDWADADPAEGKLSCRINLHTSPLLEALSGIEYETVRVDIEEIDTEGNPFTIQFQARIISDIVRGTEGTPDEADPAYITLAQAYAAFLAVTPTEVVETATDALSYDVEIEAEPAQVILSVRRPEGGTSHLAASWSIEDAGATLRLHLSALPPAGTKIYATIIESAP